MPPKTAIIKKKDAAPAKAKPAPAAKQPEAPEHQEEEDEDVATAEVPKDAPAYDGSTYPKRGTSSYIIWLSENSGKLPKGFGFRKGPKGAGIAWRKIEDKSEWEAKARQDKERFQQQLTLYNEMHPDE